VNQRRVLVVAHDFQKREIARCRWQDPPLVRNERHEVRSQAILKVRKFSPMLALVDDHSTDTTSELLTLQ
jgi:hypothetical protein